MDIQIFGQRQLQARIKNGFPVKKNLISIGNPVADESDIHADEAVPQIFIETFSDILRLSFHDTSDVTDSHADVDYFSIPRKEHVMRAIAFYKQHPRDVAVHCWAGVSRSTAMAFGLMYVEYGDEIKALDQLFLVRPFAMPNKLILQYFDELLGCKLQETWKSAPKHRLNSIRKTLAKYAPMPEILEEVYPLKDFGESLIAKGIIASDATINDDAVLGEGLGKFDTISIASIKDSDNVHMFVVYSDQSTQSLVDITKEDAMSILMGAN
jgi:predicted protein tyrosine phosphatase